MWGAVSFLYSSPLIHNKGEGGKKRRIKSDVENETKKKKTIESAAHLAPGPDCCSWFTKLYEDNSAGLSKIEMYPNESCFQEADFVSNSSNSVVEVVLAQPKNSSVLILSRSAIRACKLLKDMSWLQRPVYKLFPKNSKLDNQIEQLKSRPSTLAVGTINRVLKLVEKEALENCMESSDAIIIIDLNADVKSFNILSLNEVKEDLFKFIREQWLPRTSRPKICFM